MKKTRQSLTSPQSTSSARLAKWGKIAAWSVTTVVALTGTFIAYKSYVVSRDANSATAKMCGAVADVRASFLEVGAEVKARNHVGRSKSRDALERDLGELTTYANRTKRQQLITAATNARLALATGLNLPPPTTDAEEASKACFLLKFLREAERISAYCRAQGLPAGPEPKGTVEPEVNGLLSVCEPAFVR